MFIKLNNYTGMYIYTYPWEPVIGFGLAPCSCLELTPAGPRPGSPQVSGRSLK